jgi:hypothetical protein
MQLWDHRQSISTAMNLALGDDDMYHYGLYQHLFAVANQDMYAVLQKGMRISSVEEADCERQDWRAASARFPQDNNRWISF